MYFDCEKEKAKQVLSSQGQDCTGHIRTLDEGIVEGSRSNIKAHQQHTNPKVIISTKPIILCKNNIENLAKTSKLKSPCPLVSHIQS